MCLRKAIEPIDGRATGRDSSGWRAPAERISKREALLSTGTSRSLKKLGGIIDALAWGGILFTCSKDFYHRW
jgi:hypothetical protein